MEEVPLLEVKPKIENLPPFAIVELFDSHFVTTM